MAAPAFVHLRLHSEYSIVDGTVRIDQAVAAAIADAMPALALTDLGNVFGLVKFYKTARAAGVKPLWGCDVWLTHDAERDAPFRALLLAQTRVGYLRLAEWLTRAYRSNAYRGRAELRREWFDEGTEGLIALSGARDGDVGQQLSQGHRAGAARAARDWAARFPDRYYLELQRAGRADDEAFVAARSILRASCELPVVATHPMQFLRADDFRAHEARVCIPRARCSPTRAGPSASRPSSTSSRRRRWRLPSPTCPKRWPTVAIAQRCNLATAARQAVAAGIPDARRRDARGLPATARPRRASTRRLARSIPTRTARERSARRYEERLDFEIKTICRWASRATS